MTPTCPSLQQLESWLAERLTGPEALALEGHLQGCPSCQQTLQRLTEATAPSAAPAGPEGPGADFLLRLEQQGPGALGGPGVPTTVVPPPRDPGAAPLPSRHPPSEGPLPPRLGPYELLEQLGEGGMGQVFKARHARLGRLVALKVIRPGRLAGPDAARRFLREVQSAARLDHPNIAHALDAGEQDGRLYLAVELLEGGDLARLVKEKGPLPVGQACDCVRQAALALQHAHERGLVHRDVKPANLLLSPSGTLKLLDLGLARLGEGGAGGDASSTSLTFTGMVMGTPDYMAPEQILDSKRVDVRADLYSLGCVLYFLLAGRPPFPGGSLGHKFHRHQHEQPEPLEALRPDVPAALVGVVRKLMSKRPEERFHTPAELVGELERLMARGRWRPATPFTSLSEGELAVIDPSWRQWSRRGRPRWLIAGGVAVLLCAAVVAVALVASRRRHEPGPPSPPPRVIPALDKLARSNIPDEERPSWLPPEVVQVLGSHGGQHGALVYCLAFSPDGKRAFSGGNNSGLRVWDTGTLRELTTLPTDGPVTALAVVPEGGRHVLYAADAGAGRVRRWDASTYRALESCPASTNPDRPLMVVNCLSPDGRFGLRTADLFLLYDLRTGGERRVLENDLAVASLFRGAAFTPDSKGALLAVAGGQFALLDTGTGKERWRFASPSAVNRLAVNRLAVTPDGKHALSGDADGNAWLWGLATGRALRKLAKDGRSSQFAGLAVSADGRRALFGFHLWGLDVWGMGPERDELIRSLWETYAGLTAVVMTADGKRALTGDVTGRARLWDLDGGKEVAARPDNVGEAHCVALSPDGALALVGRARGLLTLWDVVSGKPLWSSHEKTNAITAVAFSSDGSSFAWGSHAGFLCLCDTATREPRWKARHPDGHAVQALVFSRDGKKLYSAGGPERADVKHPLKDFAVRVWDVATGNAAGALEGHREAVRGLALSPDGARLLSCSGLAGSDYTVRLWRLDDHKELRKFTGHTGQVLGVAFSPDGKTAASTGLDYTVRLWGLEAPPGGPALVNKQVVVGHCRGLTFTPDGKQVVVVGVDGGRVSAWTVPEGKLVGQTQLPGPVYGLAVSKDGRHLAVANTNGTAYILRLPLRPPPRKQP